MVRLPVDDADASKHLGVFAIYKILFIHIYVVHLLVCIIQNMKFGKCHAKVHGKVYAGTDYEGPVGE